MNVNACVEFRSRLRVKQRFAQAYASVLETEGCIYIFFYLFIFMYIYVTCTHIRVCARHLLQPCSLHVVSCTAPRGLS